MGDSKSLSHFLSDGGVEVVIYAMDAGGEHPIHGAYKASEGVWCSMSWMSDGRAFKGGPHPLNITELSKSGAV